MVIELSEVQFGLYLRDRKGEQRDYNSCMYPYVTRIFLNQRCWLKSHTVTYG